VTLKDFRPGLHSQGTGPLFSRTAADMASATKDIDDRRRFAEDSVA
jgi:hypothetical protein